ncbi:MAG: putative repeat protein (TIGR01451 family) [Saprospiraceae bacterium]|jgi:uncharacterized repeat protein (TIGR01451 family)
MRKTTLFMNLVSLCAILVICLFSISANGQQQFDVALTKTSVTNAPVKYGTPIPFNLTIYNQGLDTIMNVEVIDHYGDGYEFQSGLNLIWSEHLTIPNAVITTYVQKIPPSESRIVTINLIAIAGDQREDWINTAEVVDFTDRFGTSRENEDLDSTGDEIPDNDAGGLLGSSADNTINGNGTGAINDGVAATDEDDHDRDTIRIFDLALTKVLDPITGYSYGDTLTFTTTVYNQGNIRARTVRVRDIVPEGYINPVAENVALGWSNDAANPIYTFDVIEPFSQVEIELKLILDPTQADGDAWINFAEVISARFDNNGADGGPIGNNLDADSQMASNTNGERSVGQGDPEDNKTLNTPIISATNPQQNVDQDDHDPAEPEVFDLALIKERATALSSFNYGTPIDYAFTVVNQGNMAATNIVLVDSLPCGAIFNQAINPNWTYDNVTRIATRTIAGPLQPLVQGSTAHKFIDTLELIVVACFEDPETAWTNYMEISQATNVNGVQTIEIDGVFDSNFKNDAGGVPLTATDNALDGDGIIDEDNHDVELLQVYDLALKKELITEGPYTEGQDLDFRIRVYNQGNIVIEDLVVEDFVPEGYGFNLADNTAFGWTNSYTTIVGGSPTTFPDTLNVMNDIFLETEDSIDIIIRLQLELDGTDISDWYNYAHIFVATDTVGNNRFDDADSNPFMPTAREFAVIPGSPNDNNIFSPGKSVIPAVEEDDHDVGNISFFDLALTKTSTLTPTGYGQPVTFDIVVKNEGVQFAHDITVVDYLPCGLTFTSSAGWTINGSTGNPEYFYTDTLFAGEEVTIPITLTIEECTSIDADSYRNEAEIANALNDDNVTGDDQDSTPDDNPNNPDEDDSDDALISVFDLSLTKTISSPPTNFTIGTPVSYEIVITNEGNTAAVNIEITDYIPCGLDFSPIGNTGWSEDLITGNISYVEMSQIDPNQSVTIPLTLTIGSCVGIPLNLDNLVEISNDNDLNGPVNDFDSTPDNGDLTEDDIDIAPLSFFDLALEKTLIDNVSILEYGQDLNYEIIVTNEGSIDATSFTVTDYLPCGLGFSSNNGWTLDNQTGYLTRTYNTPLISGQSVTLNLILTLEECAMPNAISWNNFAEISAANDTNGSADDEDSTPNNLIPSEDDQDDAPLNVFDLSLIKTVTSIATEYEIGQDVIYNIRVANEGNVDATGIEIVDIIPCGMVLSANNSLPWNVGQDGFARYTNNGTIAFGQSENFEIRLTVAQCQPETGVRVNTAEISDIGNEDDVDSTPENGNPDEDDIDDITINIIAGTAIGDFVFNDLDGDGIQDINEPGILGVVVTLFTEAGDIVAIFETGADGLYLFEEVDAGQYYITFEVNDDVIPSPTNAGNDTNDSNVTEENGPGSTSVFEVILGQEDLTIDAGFFICSLIKGVTYYDVNEDDIRQSTENGINGLVVNLYRKVNGLNILWDSEITHHDYDTPSDDGIWDFCVGPGQYFIEVVMPPIGLVRVRPFIGGANFDSDINNANGPNTTPTFNLSAGGSKTNLGAGYYPMATVGNRVWMDENANGIQEDNEAKVAGVLVQIFNMDHDLIDQAITNAEGVYTIEYLMKDEYYLKFEAPEGYAFTFANATSDDVDSDVNHAMGLNTTSPRFFNPGDVKENIDAGIVNGVLPVIWTDINIVKETNHNLLAWSTGQELNVESYIIERRLESEDRFRDIGKAKAAGNSYVEQTYNFIDEDVSTENKYYYQVRQIDFDGKYSYSKIVVTERIGNGRFNMYPNPTSGRLNLEGPFDADESYSVQIINNLGQVVIQSNSPENGVDLDELPNGVYSIFIKGNNDVIHQEKIIKL